jgi:hypothetical protein
MNCRRFHFDDLLLFLVCVFLVGQVLNACTPPPTPVVPDATVDAGECAQDAAADVVSDSKPSLVDAVAVDAPLATPCARACSNLAAHGCEEVGQQCMATCEHLVATGLTPFSAECVYGATGLQSLRSCPAVKCLQGH